MNRRAMVVVAAVLCTVALGCGEQSVGSLKKDAREAFVQEQYGEVRRLLQLALAKEPSDREALFLIGSAYRRDQVFDSALLYLKRADLYSPRDREINLQLFELGQLMKDWQVSIDAIGVLIGTGDRPEAHYAKLAELWGRNNHPFNAYYWNKLALAQDSTRENLWLEAAYLAGIVDSNGAALRYLDAAVARFGDKPVYQNGRAVYYMQQSQPALAEPIFRQLLTEDSSSVQTKLNLAKCLALIENPAKQKEGLAIFKSLVGRVGADVKLDSIVASLESTLTVNTPQPGSSGK